MLAPDDAAGAPAPAPPSRRRRRLVLALRFAVALLVVGGFYLFVRGLDFHSLLAALGRAALLPILAATALNFVHMMWKALRWKVMLAPAWRVGALRLFRYTVANYAASTLLPARAGELVRMWLLKTREGVPAAVSAGVALGEMVLEALAMLLMVAPVPWLIPSLPAWIARAIQLLAGGGALALAAAWIALWRARPGTWLGHFAGGIHVLGRPGGFLLALGISLVAWLTDMTVILLVFRGLGLSVPAAAPLLVLLTVNLAVAVPSTPGQVGAFEIGAVVALDLLGVPRVSGLAFALVYHAVQVVPLALIGLTELRLIAQVRSARRPPSGGQALAATAGLRYRDRSTPPTRQGASP